MNQRQSTKELDFPFILCVLVEQVLLAPHECLAKHHCGSWELPLLSIFILENQEHSVLRSIVQTADIACLWINLRPIFTSSTISLVAKLVSREVIQIHLTYIRVLS